MAPLACSPITPVPPTTVERGWKGSTRRSDAGLRITDCTPLTKVLVLASTDGEVARALGAPFGRAARDGEHSYLLHCAWSSGRYLFGVPLDAGEEFGIEVEGFAVQESEG